MFSPLLLTSRSQASAGDMTVPVKILVLEEDHGITDLLKTVAEPDCFEITVAFTEQQGLELADSVKPDVIILVLDKPDAGGLITCEHFRQSSRAPILVLSSNGKPTFAEQVLNAGADDYLSKPATSGLIVASVNKLTRRARAEKQAVKKRPAT
jgi:two-component system KDP operon response regulator KdpE